MQLSLLEFVEVSQQYPCETGMPTVTIFGRWML